MSYKLLSLTKLRKCVKGYKAICNIAWFLIDSVFFVGNFYLKRYIKSNKRFQRNNIASGLFNLFNNRWNKRAFYFV